jgi:acetolactate synthase-1/2/3 large subunit
VTRVADIAAATLAAHGVRLAFGMPGGEVVTFVDALERAGIRFVLARNETAAAMMAAGASTLSGTPGLAVTTLGPGLANAVNGIADAAQEHIPLIVVSGAVERGLRARYTHQIVDHAALLRPLVKASFEIEADGVAATVRRALRLATAAPCGPVHLDLAPDTAARETQEKAPARAPRTTVAAIDARHAAIDTLRGRLGKAVRPLVIAGFDAVRLAGANGNGGRNGDSRGVLARLAERGVPVLTTYKAKGAVDERHALALGAAGLSPLADGVLKPLVASADLVLLAGYDPIEMRPGWLDPFADPDAVVELTRHAVDHGMHSAGATILGDPLELLAAVERGLSDHRFWPAGEPAAAKAALAARFAPPSPWGPHAVVDGLATVLPDDAVVTVDSGAHRILFSQRFPARRPLSVLQSAGWCTMGSAIPLAIGAKLAAPRQPVVALLGDGGLEMTLGELATLRDAGLAVVVVVLQDESLALIELKQAKAGLARIGVALGPTRYEAVAEAFGGTGVRVRDAAAFGEAVRGALARSGFTVVVCEIEARDYVDRI